MPGVRINLTDISTGQIASQLSDGGTFILTNLKPGVYNVAVEANGFKQSVREGLRLATGERVRLEVVLEPGAMSDNKVRYKRFSWIGF